VSGFVDTSAQKSAAEKDASAIRGVRDVRNNLIVSSTRDPERAGL